MRIFSTVMVFLMLFAAVIPGVAFADEPQTSEEVTEETVVNQEEMETGQESQQQPVEPVVEPEADPQDDAVEQREETPPATDEDQVEEEAGLTEEVDQLEDIDKSEEEVQEILDEVNAGLKLEAGVNVEKNSATVTAKMNHTTEHELTDGTFTFDLAGKAPSKFKEKETEAQAVFNNLEDGEHQVTIKYSVHVMIDGQPHSVAQEKNLTFTVDEDWVEADIEVYHYYDSEYNYLVLDADLPDYIKANGTWTFQVDGQKQTVNTKREPYAEAGFELSDPKPGQRYEAVITFEGEADKEKVKGSTTYAFTLIDASLDLNCTDKGLHVTASLNGADSAEGEWWLGLWNWDKEDHVAEQESDWKKGTTYSHTFDKSYLVPGYYDLDVYFYGFVNGEEVGADAIYEFEVDKDDPCSAGAVGPKPGNGGQKPDDGKIVTPEQPKQTAGEIKQGATMPKTATEYPLGMLIGTVVALLGAGLYLNRRRTLLQ
ncbi:hypothetical protein [Desmospora profundinema]|uniref:LPXTG cell wall anchor domain-containing protein n=1 Tax=Desmospora profundinema TaxID=1571184 RepID=A0ABU1IL26_9BACL|nr:hypothetical protein [Desmospora profundinema]MDR6225396.1 hypothetical protein [Desmospora profundinema]